MRGKDGKAAFKRSDEASRSRGTARKHRGGRAGKHHDGDVGGGTTINPKPNRMVSSSRLLTSPTSPDVTYEVEGADSKKSPRVKGRRSA